MNLSLFKKQILLMAGSTLVFLGFGLLASVLVTQMDRVRFEASPAAFLARLVDHLSEQYHVSREEAVEVLKTSNEGTPFPISFEIVNLEQAQSLAGGLPLPEQPYKMVEYGTRNALHFQSRLIRLNEGNLFLSVNYHPRASPLHRIVNPQSAMMMSSVFLAGVLSMSLLFYSMRRKAKLAAQVIAEMRDGNLNARFPVGKMDEVGKLMVEFNKMADEIQLLVETIRNTELARIRRLQELAHDLRTPVSSLKNLLETLQQHQTSMPKESQEELLGLSLKEVDYFARLVEDLLFLAQVTEPKYSVVKSSVDLATLIEDELDSLRARYPATNVVSHLDRAGSTVKGDAHLLRRLFRNALENAFSFARSQVEINLKKNGRGIVVVVRDDGHGFNEDSLAAFGEKRGTRVVTDNAEGRLSVGLGSVIMKAVATVHGGTLAARNRGTGHGAEIELILTQE